jgi:hypothetical protein
MWPVVAAAAAVLSCAGCGTAETFDVHGRLGGEADSVDGNGNCVFDTVIYEVGDDAVLRGADNTILSVDHLKKGPDTRPGTGGICDLAFQFSKLRPGDAAYQLTLGVSRPVIVTEQQLRAKELDVMPRGPAAKTDPELMVKNSG